MAGRLDVIGIGHVTCDIICPLEGWPERDTKTVIPGLALAGGGPTANALAALAQLGVAVGLAGKLGADPLGRFTWEEHRRAGIDVSHLAIAEGTTSPVSVILADLAEATRTILLTKGERTTVEPDELDWNWLGQARMIHLDGHQLPAGLAVAREARGWPDTTLVFDAGSMREGMLELCGLCDVVIASRRFARELTGGDDPRACVAALHERGARVAGVTRGAEGSLVSAGGRLIRQGAYAVEARDTTGAGDAYHGGFMYGLLRDRGLDECARIASAVAALKCRGFGARAALPSADELNEFLASHRAVSG